MPAANVTSAKPATASAPMHTPSTLAELFSTSVQTVHRMERAGGLPKALVLNTGRGRLLRWPAEAIADFIAGHWRPEKTA